MCLYLEKKDSALVAEEDITVYKLLSKTAVEGMYISPYQKAPYVMGGTYTSLIGHVRRSNRKATFDTIEVGLHSFEHYTDAIGFANMSRHHSTAVVVECIIPKGSTYYKGGWGMFDYECIASDTLHTIKVLYGE